MGITYEIGSMLKPSWRVQAFAGRPITEESINEAVTWGQKLGIENYKKLVELLKRPDSLEKRKEVVEWSVLYALKLFEKAGLDYIYTGEMARKEMYEHVARRFEGFKFFDSDIQSLDYAYYSKGAIVSRIKYVKPIHLEEFLLAKKLTDKPLKVPITGPYTLIEWSFNDYYEKEKRKEVKDLKNLRLKDLKFEAKKEAIRDFVDEYRKEIKTLLEAGAEWIQIDEPAVTTHPEKEEMELFVEATNRLTEGLQADFSLHNCYSDYRILAKYSPHLRDIDEISLELANRDTLKLGTTADVRPAYEDLKYFLEAGYKGKFGLGVVHIHDYDGGPDEGADVVDRTVMEKPELVRDRILRAAEITGFDRINPAIDCGLRRKTWDVAYSKLKALVEGANMAKMQLGK